MVKQQLLVNMGDSLAARL